MSSTPDQPIPPLGDSTLKAKVTEEEIFEVTETVVVSEKRTDQQPPSAPATSAAPSRPERPEPGRQRKQPQPQSLYARLYAGLSPFSTYIVAALVIALVSIVIGLKASPRFATTISGHLEKMASSTVSPSAPPPGATTPSAVAPSSPAKVVTTPSVAASSSAAAPSSSGPAADSEKPAAADEPEPFKFKGNFKEWNRLADSMDRFHNHFRWEYKNVYDNALGGYAKKRGQNLQRFLREAEQLAHHLDMHHRIEEAYIFPLLAKKMPQFKDGGRDKGAHIRAHKGIHDGLERYQAYINSCKSNPDNYDGEKLRSLMDAFHDVLFNHLDSEVEDLGAESVQKAGFTLEELKRFPM